MSLASKFRSVWTPTYGVCGGASEDCAVRKEDLDPMDQLFYDHDWGCKLAEDSKDPYEREALKKKADHILYEGLSKLTDEDMKKIPVLVKKFPFFKRWYAYRYREACLKIFK